MSALLGGGSAPKSAPPTVDWIARVTAGLSLLVSITTLVLGQRGKVWRGRRDGLPDLTVHLDELRTAVDAVHQNPTNLFQCWTERKNLALETLPAAIQGFPDLRMRRAVGQFRTQFQEVRGDRPVHVPIGGDPPAMTAGQRDALARASATLKWIDRRVNVIQRKGRTG